MTIVRRLCAAVCAAFLLGCSSAEIPPGPGPTEPKVAGAEFIARDGTRLAMREWLPPTPPNAVVVALHGFNDYSRAFEIVPGAPGVGPYLNDRGIAVYAFDQRGFGHSQYPGVWPGYPQLLDDFRAFVAVVRARHPGVPVFALGESMGGAVVLAAMAGENAPRLDGAILVAPAVWGRATMPFFYRASLWVARQFVPGWRPTGQGLGKLASDNIPMLRENGSDPLFIKKTRIDAVFGLVNLMDAALAAPGRIRGPVLYMYGAKDEIIPKAATQRAVQRFADGPADLRFAFYEDSWHMMLRDLKAEVPLADIAAFIADTAAALPSGAEADALARLAAKKPNDKKPPPRA